MGMSMKFNSNCYMQRFTLSDSPLDADNLPEDDGYFIFNNFTKKVARVVNVLYLMNGGKSLTSFLQTHVTKMTSDVLRLAAILHVGNFLVTSRLNQNLNLNESVSAPYPLVHGNRLSAVIPGKFVSHAISLVTFQLLQTLLLNNDEVGLGWCWELFPYAIQSQLSLRAPSVRPLSLATLDKEEVDPIQPASPAVCSLYALHFQCYAYLCDASTGFGDYS